MSRSRYFRRSFATDYEEAARALDIDPATLWWNQERHGLGRSGRPPAGADARPCAERLRPC